MPQAVPRIQARCAILPSLTLTAIARKIRIENTKLTRSPCAKRKTQCKVIIAHPHKYAEETHLSPDVVSTIADALDGARVPQHSIPDIVLWAGQEAARNRGSAPTDSSDGMRRDEDSTSVKEITQSSTKSIADTVSQSDYGQDRPLSQQIPFLLYRSSSFELPKSPSASIRLSSERSARRRIVRVRNKVSRRIVIAWKRTTAITRRKLRCRNRVLGKRNISIPSGFELVEPRTTSWWRKNSALRRKTMSGSSRSSVTRVG